MSASVWLNEGFSGWLRRAPGARAIAGRGMPRVRRGERILARELMPSGGVLVATNHALHVCEGDPDLGLWQRVEWRSIRSVLRSRHPDRQQVVQLRLRESSDNVVLVLHLRERSRIADLAAELASAATIVSRRVILSDSSVVTFTAQRDPNADAVAWVVDFERDNDRSNAVLVQEVDAALRELRSQMGC